MTVPGWARTVEHAEPGVEARGGGPAGLVGVALGRRRLAGREVGLAVQELDVELGAIRPHPPRRRVLALA